MDDVVLRSLDGATTLDEERALAVWRAESPEHERRYWRLSRIVGALGAVASLPRRLPRPMAAHLVRRSAGTPTFASPQRVAPWLVPALLAAAVFTLAVGLTRSRVRAPPAPPVNDLSTALTEVTTGPDERSTTRLSDGSIVRLAPNSRLSLGSFSVSRREVWVDGTAFFAVAKQSGAPFTVRTSAGSATVLGTQFELRASDRKLRVVVVEGRVEVDDGNHPVQVSAGEMTVVGAGIPAAVSRVSNAREIVAWIGMLLVFQDTPLEEVAAEIEKRYGLRVEIEEAELAGKVVTASFSDQPAEQVLSVVCQVVDAECSIGDGVASVSRRR
jgi:ferric-dicitrate binding protein FerR (iron transport regulator)